MKKIFFGVAVLAAMMATSCQNEELVVSQQQGNVVVNASTVNESRTYVEGKTVYWSEGDRILAYGEDVLGSLKLVGTGGDVNGRFIGYVSGNVNNLEYLIYPADMASYKDGKVTIKIGTIDKKHSNAPMFAAYGSNVTFEQLSAMIRIQINNVPANNNDLTVSGAGIGSAVFENGALTFNATSSSIKVTGLEEGTNEICIPVFTSNSAAADVNLTFSLAGATTILTLPLAQKTLTANSVPVLTYDAVNKKLTEATDLPESVDPAEGYVITTLTELVQFANEVNGGNTYEGKTVTLKNDIDLDNMPWTPITGFMGTFDGQEHMISNLNVSVTGDAPAGLFAQATGVIKNLTLQNVNISGHYKAGAVVGDGICAKIVNCHVNGGIIKVTPLEGAKGNNAGGIVGYLSAEPDAYVQNCTVNGLDITAYSDVAGIAGTANEYGAEVEVNNNTVTNTNVTADQTVEYTTPRPANAGQIVGRNIGKANLITNTATGVTVVTLVATAEQLTNAINEGENDQMIAFANDIEGNAIAVQKENVKVTIDGRDKQMKGTITVNGKSARYETAALTIKNVNFEAENVSYDAYIRLGAQGDTNTRYTNNVTVDNCTFDYTGNGDVVAVKSYTGGDWNLKVKDCVAEEGMHSLINVSNVEKGLEIIGCEVYAKSGINLNYTPSLMMDDCTFDVKEYAVRFGVNGAVGGQEKVFEIKDSKLESACEDGEAVIVFRDNAKKATLKLNKTELIGATEFAGEEKATIVIE